LDSFLIVSISVSNQRFERPTAGWLDSFCQAIKGFVVRSRYYPGVCM